MIRYTCDRCDKEIDENYFTCKFGSVEDRNGQLSCMGASLNAQENMRDQRMLCYECMVEIKQFADSKKEKTLSYCTGYATGRFTVIPLKEGNNNVNKGCGNKKDTRRVSKRHNNSFFGW